MMVHELKIRPMYLGDLVEGTKTFEVRERRDRNFQVGDTLRFRHDGYAYDFEVTYILDGPAYGLKAGHCIMSVVKK